MEPMLEQPIIPSRAVAQRVTAASDTMEDWLEAKSPPVRDHDLGNCFVAFGDTGATSLLTVDPDNKLVHLRPSNDLDLASTPESALSWEAVESTTKSDSGWACDVQEVPDSRQQGDRPERGDISHLRAFQHGTASYALAHFQAVRYVEPLVRENGSGRWKTWEPEGEAGVALLGKPRTEILVDREGRRIIYGKSELSRDHDVIALVFHDETRDQWRVATSGEDFPATESTYRLVENREASLGGTLMRFGQGATVEYQDVEIVNKPRFRPYLDCSEEAWKSVDLGELIDNAGDLAASRFLPVPGRPGSFLVHAEKDGHVWLVSGFGTASPAVACLTRDRGREMPARQLRVAVDRSRLPDDPIESRPAGSLVVYLVDRTTERSLWVKRESLDSDPSQPSFDAWVPLGSQVRTMTAPRITEDGAEVFLVNDDHPGKVTRTAAGGVTIERKSFDSATGQSWHTSLLAATGQVMEDKEWKCSTHTSVLTLLAEDDSPAYRARAGLSSSYPCVAVVNGISRHLRPGRSIPVFADDGGLITIKTRADTTDGPVYSVSLEGTDGEPLEVNSTEAVPRRLTGREKHAVVTKKKLEETGLLPSEMSDDNKNRLMELVRDAGEAIGRQGEGLTLVAGKPRWYHVELQPAGDSAGGPAWSLSSGRGSLPRKFRLEAGMDAATETIRVPRRGRVEGWGFLGDILNWLAETAEQLVSFTLKLGGKILELAVAIGNRVFELIIDTAHGIARAMEALFQGLVKAVGEAVDAARQLLELVKALFDPRAIRRTNDSLQYLMLGGLKTLEDLIGDGLNEMTTELAAEVVKRVNGALDGVKDHIRGDLAQLGAGGLPDGKDGKSYAAKKGLLEKGGVQARWAVERMAGHRETVNEALAAPTGEVDSRLLRELGRLAKLAYNADDPAADSLARFAEDLADDLKKSLERGGMSALSVVDLLGYCQRLVAMAGELIATAVGIVLGLVADAIKAFRTLLATEMRIPGIEQLGRLVLGRTPKIGDLLTFVPAVAVTVFWKVCTFGRKVPGAGSEPFPEELAKKLVKEGPFTEPTDKRPRTPLPLFMLAYYSRSVSTGVLKKPTRPQDDRRVKDFVASDVNRAIFRWLAPINNVCKLVATVLSAFGGLLLDATRDGLNIAKWDIGKWAGRARIAFFTIPPILFALVEHVAEMVKSATIEFFPQSEDGRRWAKERELLPPWGGFSLSFLVTVIFSLVGFLCMSIPADPGAGMLAYYCISFVFGGIVVTLTAIYTAAFIAYNVGRGKEVDPWKIAREIGAIIAGGPSVWGFSVPALAITARTGKLAPIAAVLGVGLLLINATCGLVSSVTSIGNIISETTIRGWGFATDS